MDPDRAANEAELFWHPDDFGSAVILTAARSGTTRQAMSLATLPGEQIRRVADDGLHVLIRHGSAAHQLWVIDPPGETAPLAALIPLDRGAGERAEAALRLWRSHPPDRPLGTDRQTQRLAASLQVLDGHRDGASYREIGESLFGPGQIAAYPWKTSPFRDRVIRLLRTGLALMRGGYRMLLRPRRQN